MNVVLFLTDQERSIQHFPPDWERRNLPGLTRLKGNGLSFDNAFTNACMCSPARSTLMTGYFPPQHGVKYTLEEDMTRPKNPQYPLPVDLKNIASVASAAGYNVIYKGKWHCSKPAGSDWAPSDLATYSFQRWDPPDAGANQDPDQAGGGTANNDGRFMHQHGRWQDGDEGALKYLIEEAARQQPFFLIISLVNPHDVLFYPSSYKDNGYNNSWLLGDIGVPETIDENLSTKPHVQQQFLDITNLGLGQLSTRRMQRHYLNFYGNLIKLQDRYLVRVLDTLEALGLRDNTLIIRTSDHGEMGLAHGGLRQKNFNFYEETLRIPLVYSNPLLYRKPHSVKGLVSHVDFLPTLASLLDAPATARADWQGIDYSTTVLDAQESFIQDYIVFTYDDFQSGQAHGPYPTAPNHIVSIREQLFKLAEYYDADGVVPSEWEMYDLALDPLETTNLAYQIASQPASVRREFKRLREKLRAVQATRLQPLG